MSAQHLIKPFFVTDNIHDWIRETNLGNGLGFMFKIPSFYLTDESKELLEKEDLLTMVQAMSKYFKSLIQVYANCREEINDLLQ